MFASSNDYPHGVFGFLPALGGLLEAPSTTPTGLSASNVSVGSVTVSSDQDETQALIEFEVRVAP